MNKMIVILVIAVMLVAFSEAAYSQQCSPGKGLSSSKGEVINITCPVMGDAVDKNTPHKTVYKGKTVGFCCAGCVKTFKENPEQYCSKIKKEE